MVETYKKSRIILFSYSILDNLPNNCVCDWSYCDVKRFEVNKKTRIT